RGRRDLNLAKIVAAGIALADEAGVAALSMRKVADRLGVGTMSLYTYVPGKDDLVEVMIDTVYAEIAESGAPSADGRAFDDTEAEPDGGKPIEPAASWRRELTAVAEDSFR